MWKAFPCHDIFMLGAVWWNTIVTQHGSDKGPVCQTLNSQKYSLSRSCSTSHCYFGEENVRLHYSDVIMSTMASQITNVWIVYSTICSGADQRKHQNSASLAFEGYSPVAGEFPHKGSVMRKMFPFNDVTMSVYEISLAGLASPSYATLMFMSCY